MAPNGIGAFPKPTLLRLEFSRAPVKACQTFHEFFVSDFNFQPPALSFIYLAGPWPTGLLPCSVIQPPAGCLLAAAWGSAAVR